MALLTFLLGVQCIAQIAQGHIRELVASLECTLPGALAPLNAALSCLSFSFCALCFFSCSWDMLKVPGGDFREPSLHPDDALKADERRRIRRTAETEAR